MQIKDVVELKRRLFCTCLRVRESRPWRVSGGEEDMHEEWRRVEGGEEHIHCNLYWTIAIG